MNLTQRQRDVATLLSRGMNNKEIARELSLDPSTIRTHVSAILDRLPARNRICAAVTWDRMTR